jgi:AraC family transcriptional regulator
VSVFPAGFETWWDIPVANDFAGVVLSDDRLRSFSDEVGSGCRIDLAERILVDDPVTSRIVDLLTDGLDANDRPSRLFFERGVDLLCAQLARVHCSNRELGVWPQRRGLAAWQVKRVTGYMRDRLGQDIGLRELAQWVGLSSVNFCTAFRLATGQTPHEWLVMRRIGRARELLADPSLRITHIALTVGSRDAVRRQRAFAGSCARPRRNTAAISS